MTEHRSRGVQLTPEEVEQTDAGIAFAIRNGVSSYALARKLGINSSALRKRAGKMGLRFHSARFWTNSELEILREMALLHTAQEIADEIDRIPAQIYQQARYRRIELKKTRGAL
jgi:hypothetical protein